MPIGTEIDRIYVSLGADLTGLQSGLRQASRELTATLSGPLGDAAGTLESAFDRSFSTISRHLESAAQTGKFSFSDMVNSILLDLQRLALNQFVSKPLSNFVSGLFDNAFSFGGGRAGGGAVAAGQAFLVGERGPELFVPNRSGHVQSASANSGPPTIINFNFPQGTDVASFQRSETQISAMIARATARGQRNT